VVVSIQDLTNGNGAGMVIDGRAVGDRSRGGSLKSSWYGGCLPELDYPTLISLYLQGRLPPEKFVTERISLDDIAKCNPARSCAPRLYVGSVVVGNDEAGQISDMTYVSRSPILISPVN